MAGGQNQWGVSRPQLPGGLGHRNPHRDSTHEANSPHRGLGGQTPSTPLGSDPRPPKLPPTRPSSVLNLLRARRRFRGASASPRQAESSRPTPAARKRANNQGAREGEERHPGSEGTRGDLVGRAGGEWEGWGELNAGKEETLATSHLPSLPT